MSKYMYKNGGYKIYYADADDYALQIDLKCN